MKFLLTSLIATSVLLAEDEVRMRNLENRVTSLEDSQNGCCYINPPARPFPAECWGLYVSVDPLIWQANANGLPTVIETFDGSDLLHANGKSRVRNFSFDWDWGVRTGIGLNTLHDGWDVLLQWTHFRSDARRKVTADVNDTLVTTQGHPAITSPLARESSSEYELHYDLLDLVNGRQFYVSKYLTLRPFAGFRSAWIKQEMRFSYPETFVRKEDRTFGIGIRGGIDMQWEVCRDLSLFSNYAANLLYSYHSIESHQKGDERVQVGSFYHVGKAIHDMQIGIRYDWFSCDCCYHFGIDFGWELHFHPGQNQVLNFADEAMTGKFFANQGDLGIQGFYASVRFDF